ncbi:MAG: DUF6483 family protein [Oscillospiraceae bacterium]|nr:DUF6483 family protein [Oscillospiraceae bacterium]
MAFFEKDWFMWQLRVFVDMAARLLLGKEFTPYLIQDEDHMTTADLLHQRLLTMLDEQDANGAEDLLFESVNPDDMAIYEVGLDFYNRLNEMDERELDRQDFSREEIRDGLSDLTAEYGGEGLFDQIQ